MTDNVNLDSILIPKLSLHVIPSLQDIDLPLLFRQETNLYLISLQATCRLHDRISSVHVYLRFHLFLGNIYFPDTKTVLVKVMVS